MAYYNLRSYKLKIDPFKILQGFKDYQQAFFLDSSLGLKNLGRYSFLGLEPFFTLKAKATDPFKKIREFLKRYKISAPRGTPPFLGGAVGYLSYDLGFALEEKIKRKEKADSGIPDCFFGFYNTVVIIDHLKRLLYLSALGFPEKSYHLGKALAESNLKKINQIIQRVDSCSREDGKYQPNCAELKSNFSKEDYIRAIKKAKAYIRAGDIYQVNLSQRFKTRTDLTAFQIYQHLRKLSPSCFGAYFDAGDHQILSSSPERFLGLSADRVVTRPMKGTRRRGVNKKEDALLSKQLLDSSKDKAELTMIVDLERNDLGKVCSYDSIKVIHLRELERYKTVYQTTATIEGRLARDRDRVDLLRACFPGGSITGCPKIRAMQIIEELEPQRRSIYTGALGYLSFSGGMDFNILIRTILKKKHQLYFGVGGGIVTDSNPEAEYEETLVKAKAMAEAINAG